MGKVTLGDEVLKVLRLDGARSIEDAALRTMMACVLVVRRPTCFHAAQAVSRLKPLNCCGDCVYLAAPTPSAVETGYGWLRASVWNPSTIFKLKIPAGKVKGSWCSWIVAQKGLVVPGHQPTSMLLGGSSESIELSWAKVPNWHAHRHAVNAECKRVWACLGRLHKARSFIQQVDVRFRRGVKY